MVFLEGAGDPALREPADGIIVGKCLQGAFHDAFPAGIGIGEGAYVFKVIGEVAPAAAGDCKFCHRPWTGLKHRYSHFRGAAP